MEPTVTAESSWPWMPVVDHRQVSNTSRMVHTCTMQLVVLTFPYVNDGNQT